MFSGFWLARAALRGAGNAAKGKGTPPADVRPTPCNVICIVLIVLIDVVSLAWMFAHGLNDGLLTFDIVSNAVLGFAGILTAPGPGTARKLKDMPGPGDVRQPHVPAAQLRERANELAGPAPPEDWPAPALKRAATVRQRASDTEDTERLVRVAAILIQPCRLCRVKGGENCRPTGKADSDLYLVDETRGIVIHGTRMGFAVKKGTADISDVVAQFDGGKVPDSVWKAAV